MPNISRERLYAEIGERIKKQRNRQSPKITQDALARKLEIERTSITNIESGGQRATLHLIYRIAQELNIALTDLLPEVSDEKIQGSDASPLEPLRLDKRKTVNVPPAVKSMFENM